MGWSATKTHVAVRVRLTLEAVFDHKTHRARADGRVGGRQRAKANSQRRLQVSAMNPSTGSPTETVLSKCSCSQLSSRRIKHQVSCNGKR